MKKYFNLSFIICVLFKVFMFYQMPEKIANHFSGTTANGWIDKTTDFWMWMILCAFIFGLFHLIVYLIRIMPAQYINVPNRDFWMAPKNHKRLVAVASSALYEIGAALFVFLTIITWLLARANLSDPVQLNGTLFVLFIMLFILYLVYVIYFRLYKPTLIKEKSL